MIQVFVHAEPRTLGYQFATAKVLAGATEEFRKEELRSLTDPEIREVLESEFSSLPPRLGRMILFDLTFAPKHPGGLCQQEVPGMRTGRFSILNVFENKLFQAGDLLKVLNFKCFRKSTFTDGGFQKFSVSNVFESRVLQTGDFKCSQF